MLLKHETLGFTDANGILLWFPSQNRTFLVRKPYGFGTENVKGRQIETDSIPFNHTLVHSLLNKLSQIANLIYTPRFSLNNASI